MMAHQNVSHQKFIQISNGCSGAVDQTMISPLSPLYTAWQTTPNEAKIQLDSKMSHMTQKMGLKRGQIVPCMLSLTVSWDSLV